MKIEAQKPTPYSSTPQTAPVPAQGPDGMFQGDTYQSQGKVGHIVVPILAVTTGLVCSKVITVGGTTGLFISSTSDCKNGEPQGTSMGNCVDAFKLHYNNAKNSF